MEARENIDGPIPQRGHLIVTTRSGGEWAGFAMRPTMALDYARADGPAVALLMQAAGRDADAEGARALAEDLGGLPLGLVVMGTLVKPHGGDWADWRGRLAEALAHVPAGETYPTSILGAVRLSYDRLPEDAQRIAHLCAWWAPEGLTPALMTDAPGSWLWKDEDVREAMPPEVEALAQDAARVRAGFAALAGASLITGADGVYAMHRMTAAALRAQQGNIKLAPAAAALLAAVNPGARIVLASTPTGRCANALRRMSARYWPPAKPRASR